MLCIFVLLFLFSGSHECQVSFRGEGCLFKDYTLCEKNPDHKDFIPVDKFTIDCLPLRYQESHVVQCVQSLGKLVVLVTVTHISSNRPLFDINTNRPYPFAEYKGADVMRAGSGWLRKVHIYGTLQNGSCSGKDCSFSTVPSALKAEFTIRTAAHVVFDVDEARHTECTFFYNDGLDVEYCPTALTFSGAIRAVSDIQGDWCDLTFLVCDKCHPEMFAKLIEDNRELHEKVWSNYPPDSTDDHLNLAVIVSHPHGCSKKISVGRFRLREELKMHDHFTHYIYTTATCTGSSGAPVFILGKSRRWPWCSHPHAGNCEHDKTLNYSGVGSNDGHTGRVVQKSSI
ncbi:unnamed protein product [Candidula unifasciata]|uniref:Uncharacterized protein n=1 Tax=Candidula unifasciata TaxID=100452 RepID=A0A8S3ZLR5_9EUPU|nr:unnamed protein product [Candidula unifasciata]